VEILVETNPVFIGLDQAFANSGRAVLKWNIGKNKLEYIHSSTYHPSVVWGHQSDALGYLEHVGRLKEFLNKTSKEFDIKCICMEGISFGSPGQASTRGGIWALYSTRAIRYADVAICAPRSLKLFVTGSGTAEKEDIRDVLAPKYGITLTKENMKRFDDYDAIGLAEIAYWSWRIMREGIKNVRPMLKPHELEVLWTNEKNGSGKLKGICNRPDDFYLKKIGA
jgi:Holliday junction resolvasome RuvABC endonuclease subunit